MNSLTESLLFRPLPSVLTVTRARAYSVHVLACVFRIQLGATEVSYVENEKERNVHLNELYPPNVGEDRAFSIERNQLRSWRQLVSFYYPNRPVADVFRYARFHCNLSGNEHVVEPRRGRSRFQDESWRIERCANRAAKVLECYSAFDSRDDPLIQQIIILIESPAQLLHAESQVLAHLSNK